MLYSSVMKYDLTWYNSLHKPSFQPPSWVFTPAWSVLYFLMFVALALVVMAKAPFWVYMVFGLQFFLNVIWSPLFFGAHKVKEAFLVCTILTVLVLVNIFAFYHVVPFAGVLLVPYFTWLCFASVLNYEIMRLND